MVAYDRFVALRRGLWDRFEARLAASRSRRRGLGWEGVEGFAADYRKVLQDHAWARARYPGTAAARRLATLAVAGTAWLEREDDRRRFSVRAFFAERFPEAVRRVGPEIAAAALLFVAAALLGVGVGVFEPAVAVGLLGPEAVAGLEQGRLWTESLVSTVPPAYASSAIATNNMSVALTAWAGGALAGLGALWIVLLNGYFLGAVVGVTMRYGMEGALLTFVSAHGPLELTLIVVSAGAGLAVGRALVRAGDRPRSETVPEVAREATVVLVGCLPFFLLLGLVEAFLSPSPSLPLSFKIGLGLALEAAFLALGLRRLPTPEESA